MELFEFISNLRKAGIELTYNNGKIQAYPSHILTDSIRRQIIKYREKLLIYLQIESACNRLVVKPSQVINQLISVDDEQDLINGNVSEVALKLHIKLWVDKGMAHYSKKPESSLIDEKGNNYA
ncbi:hypothetical protein [Legionella sainthelensi]|uniref:TubC N-terminal docking domain-related protein n=1 Tax=Legionella sainthelensi TaxID=28087 RepID=UPI000E201E0D|nr:hypothetical protein [Legionella sainthelensi]